MTAAVYKSDIDKFIQDQKSKLANERRTLAGDGIRRERSRSPDNKRRQWDRSGLGEHRLAEQQTNNRSQPAPERTGLSIGNNETEARRRQLQAERNREYNEMVQKKPVPNRRPPRSPDTMAPRPALESSRANPEPAQRRAPERQTQDYDAPRQQVPPPMDTGQVGSISNPRIYPFDHERLNLQRRKQLRLERQRDYREYIAKKLLSPKQKPITPVDGMGLPVGQYQAAKRKLHREINEEYRAMLAQQQEEQERLHLLQLSRAGEIDLPSNTDEIDYVEYQQPPVPDINVIGQPLHDTQTHVQVQDQFRTQYQEMTQYDPYVQHQNAPHYDDTNIDLGLSLNEQRQKEKQLQVLEEIHKREEKLRRSLDEDQIREADQEHTLHEESLHRRDKPSVAQEYEHRPAYFRPGDYERFRQKLSEDRRKEYNALLNKKHEDPPRYFKKHEDRTGHFNNQDGVGSHNRRYEYDNQRKEGVAQQTKLSERKANLPPKPSTPGGFLNKLGRDTGKQREQLNEERRREYNQLISEKSTRGRHADPGDYGNSIPGLRDANSAKLEKMKKRNEEYNEYLREKGGARRPRGDAVKHGYQRRPPDWIEPESALVTALGEHKHEETFATLPGLNYENPRSLQSEYERNKEYNEFLKQKAAQEFRVRARSQGQDHPPEAPRRGWATPTYEEMLQKKRQEEAKYRRFDDPEYKRPGIKSYGSEGALNGLDAQRRGRDLDQELEKRLRIDEGGRSILDDPLWLSPRRAEIYEKEFNSAPRYPDPPRPNPGPSRPKERDPGYYATLPVGHDERFSAQQRRKEQYRRELEQQMKEAAENKRREKLEDMKVSATGVKDPQMRDERPRGLGVTAPPPPYIAPPPTQVVAHVQAPAPVYKVADHTPVYTTRLADYDKLSPRSELVLGRKSLYTGDNQWDQIQQLDKINFDLDRSRYTAPSGGSGSILERGFDTLLDPPRVASIQPPPGLEYKPSTFITGGGVGGLSSIDETYYLLGAKNPLEPEIVGAAQPRVQVAAPAHSGAAAAGPAPAGRVRFSDNPPQRQPPGGGATFDDGVDEKSAARARAQAYQAELAKQIEEDKLKKAKSKAEQEWYDMKLEREAQDYNPYGKGGGGAPMKDDRGNIMADLRAMKKGYTTGAGYSAFSTSPRPPSPRDDKIKTPPSQTTALGEVSHARGGHGIFGMPKTEAEKHQSNVYKDDLQRQIEARKAAAAREREMARYEEEKEMRRIEAERKKMQEEYEEERKKIKAKEDEARRKNEELMRQAEERKREAEQRRREAEDERRRQQEEADRERLEREKAERVASPPIPAVTRKQTTEQESSDNAHALRVKSPPVPAARNKAATAAASNSRPTSAAKQPASDPEERHVPTPQTYRLERGKSPAEPGPSSQRAPSADILNALARMKHQLASERDRVENMLDKTENEPEVFDARLAQRPPPVPRAHDIDVFERARNRSTVPVRRAPTVNEHPPNPAYLDEFNQLKQADTDSRQEFKRHYPYDPMSNDNLEQQQAALIRQQEEGLRAMRDKSKFEKALPHMEPKDLGLGRHHSISPQPMLQSNSAFIDMNGLGPVFPDDLDDLPRRNESARQRRRDRLFSSPRPGSVTSLDVDQIARKNEQRLKKLRDMQGDDLSMNDPDDVLDRFVSKQSHNRPPTSQTMQDDSWLQAGSKLSRY